MRCLWLTVALLGCGDVNITSDAAVPDAYAPDSPASLTCSAGEKVCNDTCADMMTSEEYCGNCTTSCTPTQGCLNGACVPNFTSCARIQSIDPTAPDGLYTNPNNGNFFFCDFTNGRTYDDFRLNVFSASMPGYAVARATDFQDPIFAQAFISFFNEIKGVRAAAAFTASNCCMTTVTGQRLQFGGEYTFPGVGTGATGCAFTFVANATYTLSRAQNSGYMALLPVDFLSVNAPTEAAGCTDGTNPAYFYKRRDTLN